MIAADREEWLYAARSLAGVSLGMTYSSFSLYLGEIADSAIRGALIVLGTLMLKCGGKDLTKYLHNAIERRKILPTKALKTIDEFHSCEVNEVLFFFGSNHDKCVC